jgi:hypothetical protein
LSQINLPGFSDWLRTPFRKAEQLRRSNLFSHIYNQWAGFLALFLVITGGMAYAAFNPVSPDGTVPLCAERRSGDLHVRKGRKCDRGEKSFSINQRGPEGPQGLRGIQGEQGVKGLQGPSGATNVTVHAAAVTNAASVTANCDPGERATGGGGFTSIGFIYLSRPVPQTGTPVQWEVQAEKATGGAPGTLTAYVVCAEP